MGTCQYRYNATEQYQRTKPGTAPESCCGALTYPAVDEPELVPVAPEVVGDQVFHRMVPTGRFTARSQHDPWCPVHGGSPKPEPQPPSLTELEQARTLYAQLLSRFQATGSLPPGVDASTWQEIQAAGARLVELGAADKQLGGDMAAIETAKEQS